jgi:hypothetical protein
VDPNAEKQETVMAQQDDIARSFGLLLEQRKPVRLINTYRGIPITNDARIITISQGYVAFNVHEYQAVCMTLEGKTYLQAQLLPEVYQARAVAVDVLTRQAILTEFSGVGNSVGKRMATRVQPKEPTDVEIYDGKRRIPGKLADISTSGVGVFTFATYIYGELSFEKSENVFIDVRMPASESILRFEGKITSVAHQKGTFLHRLGVKLLSNPATDPALSQYVSQRQDEVLRELRAIYETMAQDKEKRL